MLIQRIFPWLTLLALAACGAPAEATPQLIAAYPNTGSDAPISAEYGPPPANVLVVYDAWLQLDVSNPARAAERATALAVDYGGYLVSSQSVYLQDDLHITLVLAVPVTQFERVKRALLDLGTLRSESVSGELLESGYGQANFSHITLQLRPTGTFSATSGGTGWNPARTFASAFGVFAAIFQFLVDIVIWVAVVGGPFVLAGWGLRALLRRWRAQG